MIVIVDLCAETTTIIVLIVQDTMEVGPHSGCHTYGEELQVTALFKAITIVTVESRRLQTCMSAFTAVMIRATV